MHITTNQSAHDYSYITDNWSCRGLHVDDGHGEFNFVANRSIYLCSCDLDLLLSYTW